jgi:hypothetical protein
MYSRRYPLSTGKEPNEDIAEAAGWRGELLGYFDRENFASVGFAVHGRVDHHRPPPFQVDTRVEIVRRIPAGGLKPNLVIVD